MYTEWRDTSRGEGGLVRSDCEDDDGDASFVRDELELAGMNVDIDIDACRCWMSVSSEVNCARNDCVSWIRGSGVEMQG
jgi:hypothetical protein